MRTLLVVLSFLVALPTLAQEDKKVKKNFFKDLLVEEIEFQLVMKIIQ